MSKTKKLKNIKSETRKFTYNDFSVNITKHINLYEKVLNGEVVERVEIARFEVEPIEVIEYEGVIYKANSKKVENLRKSLKNEYLKEQKRITRENS